MKGDSSSETCPRCGQERIKGDRFCFFCMIDFEVVDRIVVSLGHDARADDRFRQALSEA